MIEEKDKEKLRADYIAVRKWWKEADGWSDIDLAEADESIGRAVKSGDAELIACWANDLGKKAGEIRAFTLQVRAMEDRIREVAVVANG
ncbi:hypothetical protein [Nitrosospira briensis]|uniref:hypothetical protein n=1 Tax=Nitrosospira briensis TaxID=35799 RepID=UPI0004687DBF|nr:hypothetical protein [Nitrosospira briensis]